MWFEQIEILLKGMIEHKASDLIINANFPPCYKVNGKLIPIHEKILSEEESKNLVLSTMHDKLRFEFKKIQEANFSLKLDGLGRFRVSAFIQQSSCGMVVRYTQTEIPTFTDLNLPPQIAELIMAKRGIVFITGATGSGKSTTMAAMINHRNHLAQDHIITIEDPIEFVYTSKKSMITQREIGTDTQSWEVALKNTLRQAPNVIVIGEIRDHQAMEYAIQYSETGHLVVCTLHANNANQAIERIISLFPMEYKQRVLMDLALNLKAIISQRLLRHQVQQQIVGRIPAVEILLNTPRMADLILKGEIHALKETIKQSKEMGMVCFDDYLYYLYENNKISYDETISNADSENDLRLKIKLSRKQDSVLGASGLKLL